MLKLKLQYFGHQMWRADSLEKTLMLGRIEGWRRRGKQRIRWLNGIINLMDMSLLKLMSIEWMMSSNHFILCCPLLLMPSIFSTISVFSNESALHIGWPTYWSFSFSISPSNEYSGLIFFRMDWLDLLAAQGTLKSRPTPQFKSISPLTLSFLYGPTLTSIHDYWKNHSLD